MVYAFGKIIDIRIKYDLKMLLNLKLIKYLNGFYFYIRKSKIE